MVQDSTLRSGIGSSTTKTVSHFGSTWTERHRDYLARLEEHQTKVDASFASQLQLKHGLHACLEQHQSLVAQTFKMEGVEDNPEAGIDDLSPQHKEGIGPTEVAREVAIDEVTKPSKLQHSESEPAKLGPCRRWVNAVVDHPAFDLFWGVMILLSAVSIGAETQMEAARASEANTLTVSEPKQQPIFEILQR